MNKSWIDTLISKLVGQWQQTMELLYFLKWTPELTLTGSRSFGTEWEESDYDFFMSEKHYNFQFMKKLHDLGFYKETNNSYSGDPTLHAIYVYHGMIDVHIQIVSEEWYERKVEAQKKIKELYDIAGEYMSGISKDRMKEIWHKAMGY